MTEEELNIRILQYEAEERQKKESVLRDFRLAVVKDMAVALVTQRASTAAQAPECIYPEEIRAIVNTADGLVDALRGEAIKKIEKENSAVIPSADEYPDGITLVEQDGLKWVRIKIFDEDFMLCTKNLVGEDGKKEFQWQEAVDETEKRGWTMPNKKQWDLVDAYRDQIDKLIEEAGGDSLNGLFWSVARYGSGTAWFYGGYGGILYYYYLYGTYSVRPLAYFKKS